MDRLAGPSQNLSECTMAYEGCSSVLSCVHQALAGNVRVIREWKSFPFLPASTSQALVQTPAVKAAEQVL
jgi:hypothetical protein